MPLFRRSTKSPAQSAREEKIAVEKYIRDFVEGTGGDYDWDDFISIPCTDLKLEEIRQFCCSTDRLFPPTEKGHWCSEAGVQAIREIQERLQREMAAEANSSVNDPSSATRPTRAPDCNSDAMAGLEG
jgi:hypothetical protein